MALELRKNRFAKSYENEFFRLLSSKLKGVFDDKGWDGVLVGSPECTLRDDLQIDLLLITESAITLIDLKNYGGRLSLPEHGSWDLDKHEDPWFTGDWLTEQVKVRGGAGNKNPYKQLVNQSDKFRKILEKKIIPNLETGEKIVTKHTNSVVGFQREMAVSGTIDPRFKHNFFIADPTNIVNTLCDIHDIEPNEWQGKIQGTKLGENAIAKIKSYFRADLYSPEENSLIKTFSAIQFPALDIHQDEAIINEIIKEKDTLDVFFKGDVDCLIIKGAFSSYKHNWINKLVEDHGDDFSEINFLAPSRRNIMNLKRNGLEYDIISLYSKLYDFENSSIVSLDKSDNEREEFPLKANEDEENCLYVVYDAHLIYDFTPSDEDLIRFGSGSLLKDLADYLSLKSKKSKVIFIGDPYWYDVEYGFGQNATNPKMLEEHSFNYINIDLPNHPSTDNDESCNKIVNSINSRIYNDLSLRENANLEFRFGDDFKESIVNDSTSGEHKKFNILARNKEQALQFNLKIREYRNNRDHIIHEGDQVLFKSRALVAEEYDPYSVPKQVNNGDEGQIVQILERNEYRSETYTSSPICVAKCLVHLKNYDSERIVYLHETSNNDSDLKSIKKHLQIRIREIVNKYLKENEIQVKDLLSSEDYREYAERINTLKGDKSLFENQGDETADPEELKRRLKKVDSYFKLNKRKERFVRRELLQDINSEYYALSQLAFFVFGWALPIQSVYGNHYHHAYLPMRFTPQTSPDNYYRYLYSGFISADYLTLHDFQNITSLSKVVLDINPEGTVNKGTSNFLQFDQEFEIDERAASLKERYEIPDEAPYLIELCEIVKSRISNIDNISIEKIEHKSYHEIYHFTNGSESGKIKFNYNGRGFATTINKIDDNELIVGVLKSVEALEPIDFSLLGGFRKETYEQIQEWLGEVGLFICEIFQREWKDEMKISDGVNHCVLDWNYKKTGHFTSVKLTRNTNVELAEKVHGILEENT